MEKDDISLLEAKIRYHFNNRELLHQCLTHPSYSNENPSSKNNMRLEFLGDAVLNSVVTIILYRMFPDLREGDLSYMRSMLVNKQELFEIGKSISLQDFIFLGKGEEKTDGRNKISIVAGSLEALIGAVFLDGGFERVFEVVKHLYNERMEYILYKKKNE